MLINLAFTHVTDIRESLLDLTIYGHGLKDMIHDWSVSKVESLSDHSYVVFWIDLKGEGKKNKEKIKRDRIANGWSLQNYVAEKVRLIIENYVWNVGNLEVDSGFGRAQKRARQWPKNLMVT